ENGPENCIIDCNGSETEPHRGFYCHNQETPNSIVEGFTITNGCVPDGGGGAIKCSNASVPTIRDCVIVGNIAAKGGGIYYTGCRSYPTISNCVIRGNSTTFHGGGIFCGAGGVFGHGAIITDCVVTGNLAGAGGGISGHGKITDCTISGNSATHKGGGIAFYGDVLRVSVWSGWTVTNCVITGNYTTAGQGGGFHAAYGRHKLINCTINGNGNSSGVWCFGLHPEPLSILNIVNCVIWDNVAQQIELGYEGITSSVVYSNIQGGWEGEGNIDEDPRFAFSGDCHLMPGSPCIDAGTNTPAGGLPVTDKDGNPRILDGDGDTNAVTDIGVYEYNPGSPSIAVSVFDVSFSCVRGYSEPAPQSLFIRNCGGGTLNWEIVEDCNWLEAIPASGESTGEVNEVTLTVDANSLLPGYYSCILRVVIQAAIDAADDYDMVLVADGIYTGDGNRDIDFGGKAITVKSENGLENCIIDCNASEEEHHRGFSFANWESRDSVLDGFTIINGYSPMGGGIYCRGSSPTIANCTISCSALNSGGGISCADSAPAIINCTISDCSAGSGGGISCGGAGGLIGFDYETMCTISNCTISSNLAEKGGGIYWGGTISTVITNCTISNNSTEGEGGGLYCRGSSWWWGHGGQQDTACSVANCLISGNSAQSGGGIFCERCEESPWPRPCFAGGTLMVANSTIAGNTATDQVGGLSGDSNWDITVTNCILWANSDATVSDESVQLHGGIPVTNYCCIQGWTGILGGNGNIGADPCFTDPGYWDTNGTPYDANDDFWIEGDYHLLPGSPCIDAGDNNSVPPDTTDFDGDGNTTEPMPWDLEGNPRIVDGNNDGNAVVDMGAYEYFVPPVEVEMKFTPRTLNPGSRGRWVKAHFVLPEEYTVEDVDVNTPAVVEPGGIESDYVNVFINEDGLVEVEATFERSAFCEAGISDEAVEVTVTGSFMSGQQFYGTDTIKITHDYFKYLGVLAAHWLEEECDK
ncbi:MAG: choice-of-anchor Q domain-containing protein, partial [Planctomycetota bacterium]